MRRTGTIFVAKGGQLQSPKGKALAFSRGRSDGAAPGGALTAFVGQTVRTAARSGML
jgi:hypothetical protein